MSYAKYLLLLPLLFWSLSGIARIAPEERGVVKRFGQIVAKPGPGLWIGFPRGIDSLERIALAKVRRLNVGYSAERLEEGSLSGQFLTGDQNLVNVLLAVDYAVADADQGLEDFVLNQQRMDSVIGRTTESVLAEWIASKDVDEVLLTGNSVIPGRLLMRLQQRLDGTHLGVRIQQISVATLAPPEEVRSAFEDVNRAQTRIRTQEYKAAQEAEQRLQTAKGNRFRLQQQAAGFADETRSQAKAEVNVFEKRLASYRELKKTQPDILVSLWWEEMGKTLIGLKGRGRLEPLDAYLGPDGLDVIQGMTRKR